jgi:uncharacterized protein (DUF302 family)
LPQWQHLQGDRIVSRKFTATVFATFVAAAAFVSSAPAAQLDGFAVYSKQGEFTEVLQDLQDAIVNRGYVIDFIGHVDMMLERTSQAAGSVTSEGVKSPYKNAKVLQFCSAKLTHEAVSANPLSIGICPYVTFVIETKAEPGKITVGYRRPISGPSKASKKAFAKIEALLDEISKEAAAE